MGNQNMLKSIPCTRKTEIIHNMWFFLLLLFLKYRFNLFLKFNGNINRIDILAVRWGTCFHNENTSSLAATISGFLESIKDDKDNKIAITTIYPIHVLD